MTSEADGVMPARRLELVADQADDLQVALADGARAQHEDGDLQASRQNFERAYRLAEQAGDAQAMALAALAEVRAAADPALLAEALRIAHHCLLGPEHVTLRRELAVELTKASFRTERRSDLLMGLLWQTADAYCAGDPHAGRLLGELKGHLAERNHLAVGFVVSAIDVMLAIRAGQFADAEALAALCGSDLGALPRSSSWLVTMNGIVEAACLLGEADVATRAYELLRPYADSIGMVYLAVLIANPRQEIQAADLVAGLAGLSGTAGDAGTAHPVLDHEAIAEYRNRLRSLDVEIDQLAASSPDSPVSPDPGRAGQARAERAWLVAQLSSAAGFAGRTRSFPGEPERARVAAGKAIRRALARITEADAVIGEHLRQTVHTGMRCSYWPG